jgi:hypothetical protein
VFVSSSQVPENEWRWCGSNYDALGNDRFGVAGTHDRRPAGYFEAFGQVLERRAVNAEAGTYSDSCVKEHLRMGRIARLPCFSWGVP